MTFFFNLSITMWFRCVFLLNRCSYYKRLWSSIFITIHSLVYKI